ncbi:MAG TPA: hypothetical protein VHB77_22180, partial [Planctomycetaceae bacterium]|nr:hypothetical protein [Planctomycetaceae bacterium]
MLGTIALGGAALWSAKTDGVVAEVALVPEIPAPLVQVRCFGAEQTFAFHTGSTLCFVDESMQPQLGDPLGESELRAAVGSVKKSMYRAPDILLGGIRLRGQWAAYRELTPLAEAMGHPVTGIVGVDAVEKHVVELDLVGERLRLLSRVPPQVVEQNERLDMRRTDRGWFVTAKVADSLPVEFMLNTGTNRGITLSQPIFDRLWAAGAVKDCVETEILSMTGTNVSRDGELQRITLGRFQHDDLAVSRIDTCTLGCEYLRRYIIVFDFPRKHLYLRPSTECDKPQPK